MVFSRRLSMARALPFRIHFLTVYSRLKNHDLKMRQAGAQAQKLRVVTQMRKDAENRLAALNLAPMDPIMPPKFPNNGTIGHQVGISTNVYGMQLKPVPVYRYQVTIEGIPPIIEGRTRRTLEFTGNVQGDPNIVSRREECHRIFNRLLEVHRGEFNRPREAYFYDLKSILFTLNPLNIEDHRVFELPTSPDFFANFKMIKVTVQKVTDNFQLTTSNISHYCQSDLSTFDRSLQQFIEIAINQPIYNNPEQHVLMPSGGSYFMNPEDHDFNPRDTPALREEKYLAVGVQKAARFFEGPRGRNNHNMGIIVNPKKTPFHVASPLIVKVLEMATQMDRQTGRVPHYEIEKLKKGLKCLWVQPTHRDSNRVLKIFDVAPDTARESKIQKDGRELTIEQYFRQNYGLTLKYPEAPLICIRIRVLREGREIRDIMKFPIEVLKVVDNQRVTTEQQTREQIAQQIRACAVLPSVQKEQITKCADAINLFDNPYLNPVGIRVIPNPLQTTARMLPQPDIVYGGNATTKPNDRGTWEGGVGRGPQASAYRFLVPASCSKWESYLIDSKAKDAIDERTMTEFLKRFVNECNRRGMTIGRPAVIDTVQPSEQALHAIFDRAVKNGVEFLFFIHAGRDTHLHGMMKLFELKGIITQDLKAQTAFNVVQKNQNQTMENIVMKTNVKLGGLNNSITISGQAYQSLNNMFQRDILYIGFGANHPGGGLSGLAGENLPPTVVGFAANDGKHPFEFTGDYVYQETRRDEKVDVIKDIIIKILERFIQNRGSTPKGIVIYRNGCSEGQFADVISYEIPFIKAALAEKRCNSKLVVIVPNRLHNLRFLPSQIDRNARAPEQNVKPGTTMDSQVVHPSWNEFYLCSHTTLQGTAKVPRYTILYNETQLSADQIQEATFALAYGYQIVRSPTSLPAPAYIANKYADRGRTMLVSASKSEDMPIQGGLENDNLNVEITLANKDLLRGKRINA